MTEPSQEAVEALAHIGYTTHTGWGWDHIGDENKRRQWRHWAKARLEELGPIIEADARNRWEQEVRERLLELADKFEAEAGPNGPKQCQCCRKANKQLLDLAAAFGEAEPVEEAAEDVALKFEQRAISEQHEHDHRDKLTAQKVGAGARAQAFREAAKELRAALATLNPNDTERPVNATPDVALHVGRLEGALGILESNSEFNRDGLVELLREVVAGLGERGLRGAAAVSPVDQPDGTIE